MNPYKHLSMSQFAEMQQQNSTLQIVDIRDPASFAANQIPNSINLTNDNLADFIASADMDAPLVVVCYHGISSQRAAEYLNQQGFDDVYSLDGGIQVWSQQ